MLGKFASPLSHMDSCLRRNDREVRRNDREARRNDEGWCVRYEGVDVRRIAQWLAALRIEVAGGRLTSVIGSQLG